MTAYCARYVMPATRGSQAQRTVRRAHDLRLVLAAAAVATASEAPRILAAAGALPAWLRPFVWSDLLATYLQRGLAGHLPYFDVFFEYPPLMGYLAGAFSVSLPGGATGYVIAWAIVVVISAAAISYLLEHEVGSRPTLRGWVFTPELLFFAGLNADLLPAALLLFGAVLARRRRAIAGALALAAGTAAKLFPAIALPALAASAGRKWLVVVLAFTLAVALVMLPALAAPNSAGLGIAYYAAGYSAGGVAVWGLLATAIAGIGLGPAMAAQIVLLITTAGLVVTYAVAVLPRARCGQDPAEPIALAVIALLFWSRLYSPQFSLWILPFVPLLGLERSGGFALLVAADTAVFLTASPLTLVRWDAGNVLADLLLAVLAASVVLRHVALIALFRSVRSSDG